MHGLAWLAGAKYETGESAAWAEGDFDGAPNPDFVYANGSGGTPPPGDGFSNSLDVIAVLGAEVFVATAHKRSGEGNGEVTVLYDAPSGNVRVTSTAPITSIQLESASSIFSAEPAQNLGGPFDVDTDAKIFRAIFGNQFSQVDFGAVAQAGLSEDFLRNDLTAGGSFASGGTFGEDVELKYIPEPSTILMLLSGLAGIVSCGLRKHRIV